MDPDQIAVTCASGVAIIGGIAGWFGWVRPRWRRFWSRLDGTFDAINGREAYVDPASGRNVPALPPLTTRVANVEQAIVLLTRIEERMTSVEGRVTVLEDARVERVVTQAESAQMYRALADRDPDLLPPQPDDEGDEQPDE